MEDLISREALRRAMYHEAFEVDSDEQKWDGGCWIRYKLFERIVESIPSAGMMDEKKPDRPVVSEDIANYWKERALAADRSLAKVMEAIEEVYRS